MRIGALKHTLFIENDNDFVGTVTDTNHPNGIDNPNQFFVFAIDAADLPGYVAQPLPGAPGCDDKPCRFDRNNGDRDGHGKQRGLSTVSVDKRVDNSCGARTSR
ncbi:hypothetical protein [Caballeronia sp. INDeC2]|uniref:hypothetical protein n=1 Tax=Caballeronia sp. INDeC2 TaxID=2921747 RepID=UPI002028A53D|nr:hypothetical protein [Caballeronia sp. INDeC2]